MNTPSLEGLQQVGLRHPAAELVRDIQRNRTGIPRRTFVAEGLFENNVVLEAGVAVDTFLWCPEAAYSDEARTRSSQLAARARRAYRISEKTLTYLAERPNPDGLISIARLRRSTRRAPTSPAPSEEFSARGQSGPTRAITCTASSRCCRGSS